MGDDNINYSPTLKAARFVDLIIARPGDFGYTGGMSRDRDPLVLGLVREAQNLAAIIRFGEALLKFQDGRVVFCEVKETYRTGELEHLDRIAQAEVPVAG